MIAAADTTNDSTELQDGLIIALRKELGEYGTLLNLISLQQEAILDRKVDRVLALGTELEDQIKTTHRDRKAREEAADEIALLAGMSKPAKLRSMIPHFRPALRPLIEALVDEVNRLISQTRRRAQQNQVLLARSMELAEELITRLNPRSVSKTYSARGRVKIKPAAGMSRLLERS